MLGMGFQEWVIIFMVVLPVFGPKRLPEVGRTIGKRIGELRRGGIYDAEMQMETVFGYAEKRAHPETLTEITKEGAAGNGPE